MDPQGFNLKDTTWCKEEAAMVQKGRSLYKYMLRANSFSKDFFVGSQNAFNLPSDGLALKGGLKNIKYA